jgi:NAD(P)-dependent dehydrogenase (short-subunit alcohol dehydrogenase family)
LVDELARANGSVVNVTSIAGGGASLRGAAYSTSKAALAALTREMAADFAPRGVRVECDLTGRD